MSEQGKQAAAAVDASTVVLLRDNDVKAGQGLEVLLVERHLQSDFAGGALVFPGGKVDAADGELDDARWRGAELNRWTRPLGVESPRQALGLLVAAVRETFEEAGVLLAHRGNGSPLTDADLMTEPFLQARDHLISRDRSWSWNQWLAEQDLVLDLDALALWAWWVTPEGTHRRFDTRFLAALMPPGQDAKQDNVETTSLRWITPEQALEEQRQGRVTIIYPTRRNLEALGQFGNAREAWQAAAEGRVDQRRIQPSLVRVDGVVMVQHPYEGDPEPV